MNSIATQQKRFIQLAPSNNSSSGYGPKGSQPIIRFDIADTQALALLKDCRLNAKIAVRKSGALVQLTEDINLDPVLGYCSVMDQVIISSSRFGQQIEQVVNMGRLESSYYRSKYSPKMMASNAYNESKAVGMGRYNKWRGTTINSSQINDLRAKASRKALIKDQSVSLPFHIGLMLTDTPTDLSAVGGLSMAIYLQKAEAMFFGSDAGISGMDYTLTDVSLTVPLLYKSQDMIQATPQESVIEFLNWTSLYAVLDSSTSSIAQRLYLSGLVSGIHNCLPTQQINNLGYNQFALKQIGVKKLTFLRDGQRQPLEKSMIVQEDTAASRSVENESTVYPEILREYLSAWGPPKDLKYSQVIPQNVKGISNRDGVVGLGCNFSPEGAGINMSGVLSLDVESKIQQDTAVSPNPELDEPYALYSFYLSRQTFLASPMGLKAM